MFENKKDNATPLESPVMVSSQQDDRKQKKTPKKEKKIKRTKVPKEPKEKTKPGVFIAKILIFFIILGTIFLGLYKLILHLDEPKTIFYSALNDIFDDFSTVMQELSIDDLWKISSTGVTINADVELEASNLKNEKAGLEEIVNSLAYTFDIDLVRPESYGNISVKLLKDDEKKMTTTVLLNKEKSYLSMDNLFRGWYELNLDPRLLAIEPEKNTVLAEIIKKELETLLDDEKFTSNVEAIAVNGKTVDCKRSTYELSGEEITSAFDRIGASIEQNSVAYYYVAQLFGVNASEVSAKLAEVKKNLNFQMNDFYYFSTFVRLDSKEAVRLELIEKDSRAVENSKSVFTYVLDQSYRRIEIVYDEDTIAFEVKGNLTGIYDMSLENSSYTTTLTKSKKEKMTKLVASIVDSTNKESIVDMTFQYTLDHQSSSVHKLVLAGDLKTYENGETILHKIKTEALINSNVKIEKVAIDQNEKNGPMNIDDEKRIRTDFASFLKNLVAPPAPETPSEPVIDTPQ